MGVPKFYRWISERYPKINQIVSDSTLLPEFDNLYLDMNGILHTCTHPNDDGLSVQLSERDIILGIFHYIDRIVTHIVRPRRVLYMAIDGVAPRAKMNQQRSRRFRSRKDMKDAKLIAESKGEIVDEDSVFDSNCITPGTEFMAKISRHLRYFIQKKISDDPLWKALTVTFSGHEVPGEGEHKIMTYIRDERSAGRLPPNTRHCMYGQDADLILLGLATHEPHFTLLREVVNFGSKSSQGKNVSKVVVKTTRDAQFQLLHLSVLREYIWAEFTRDIPVETEAEMDRERVVDDFVFLTFLVGNDFLPHMPSLDIGEEAFSFLFQIYRSLKPRWGGMGYLTKEGAIENAERLEHFLGEVGSREDEIFSERAAEEEEFRGRRRRTSKRFGNTEEIPSEAELAMQEEQLQHTYENAMLETMGYVPETDDGGKDYKGRYYFEKFGITPMHTNIHDRLRAAYVEGLVWCLAYYYRGCVSWSWFFPFHYVPMISDLKGLAKIMSQVRFDLGEPFLPFEQLLGCLPGASAGFLPAPYARLMTSPESPIIDFYPEDFEIDMNGKRNPWEAVNILPFIDAYRLKAAVAELCPSSALGPEEAERNTMGEVLEYRHDYGMSRPVMSCNPEIGLANIPHCTAAFRVVPYTIEPGESFKAELPRDAVIPTAGFPSLHVLCVGSVEERKVPINVFGSASRYETLVLQLKRLPEILPAASLAPKVLGRSAFLNWPLMHEALVVGISDCREEYRLKEARGSNRRRTDVRTFTQPESERWRQQAAEQQESYLTGRGVPGSGGIDIGKVQLMLKARPLQGMRVDPSTGARRKVFGKEEADVPVHMVLWSCPAEDPRFLERTSATLEERFPMGSRVMCLHGGSGHGCGGEVVDYQGSKVDVLVDLRPPEPPFGLVVVQSIKTRYFSQQRACESLGIHPKLFGRVVGSIFVEPGKLDLGLNLKQNDRYQLLGYSRCLLRKEPAWSTSDTVKVVGSAPEADNAETTAAVVHTGDTRQQAGPRKHGEVTGPQATSWEFSAEAIRLVARYAQAFPQLFHGLQRRQHGGDRYFEANALFGHGGKQKAEEIAHWLSELETAGMQRVPLTTKALSREAVKAVERGADVRQAILVKNAMIKKTLVRGLKPSQLLAYDVAEHTDAPLDTGVEKPDLGDRVVNMRAKGVPFGLWGTVIASHSHSGCVEVVFDEEFIGGTTLHGMCSNYRGALVPWATVAKIHTRARLEALRASAAPQGAAAASAASGGTIFGRGRRETTARQAEAPAPPTKNVSILRPSIPPSSTASAKHPAAVARSSGKLSSSEALKGALGIGLSAAAPAARTLADAAGPTGGGRKTAGNKRRTGDGKTPGQSGGGVGSEASAAAAAAGIVLKGMLGVTGGTGAPEISSKPTAEASAAAGSTPTSVPGEAAVGLVPDGCGAVLVSEIEEAQRKRQPSGAAASESKATADLKAMIGVGLMQPSQVVGDPVKEEPRGAGAWAHGAEGAQERAATPPPSVGGTSPRSGRVGKRAPQLAMSPESSEQRGRAMFRQAKGPDKIGSGFRAARGVSGGKSLGAPAAIPPAAAKVLDPIKASGTAKVLTSAFTSAARSGETRLPEKYPPSTERSVSAAVAVAPVPSSSVDGLRETVGKTGSWDSAAVATSGGSGPLVIGEAAAMMSGGADGVDEATRSRGIRSQGQVLADTNARHVFEDSLSSQDQETAANTTPPMAPVTTAAATSAAQAQKLMDMIGAGQRVEAPANAAVSQPTVRVVAFGSESGVISEEALVGRVGVIYPNDFVPGGGAPLHPPSPPPVRTPPPQPTVHHQHQYQGRHYQQQQQQQYAFARPGVPLPPSAFFPPGSGMGAVSVAPPPPPGRPQPFAAGAAEGPGAQQRAHWEQQRLLEAFQQQHRHHALLQQQQLQQQQQQQQQYVAARAAPAFPVVGQYPSGAPPGGPFVQAQPYQQYQMYGYPQGPAAPPYPQSQVHAGGYPQPPPMAHFSAPAAAATGAPGSAAQASNIIPRKPRKTMTSEEKKAAAAGGGGGGGSGTPSMMIPSSALLAGSRRVSKASSSMPSAATARGGEEDGRRAGGGGGDGDAGSGDSC